MPAVQFITHVLLAVVANLPAILDTVEKLADAIRTPAGPPAAPSSSAAVSDVLFRAFLDSAAQAGHPAGVSPAFFDPQKAG